MSQDSGSKEIENENSSNHKLDIRLSILKTKILLVVEKVIEKIKVSLNPNGGNTHHTRHSGKAATSQYKTQDYSRPAFLIL